MLQASSCLRQKKKDTLGQPFGLAKTHLQRTESSKTCLGVNARESSFSVKAGDNE